MIGLFWGRTRNKFDGDQENKRTSDLLTVRLHEKFIEEFGSVTCREIHDGVFGRRFDLWSDVDKVSFEQAGAHRDKCTRLVALAASWTAELILGELEKKGIALDELEKLWSVELVMVDGHGRPFTTSCVCTAIPAFS